MREARQELHAEVVAGIRVVQEQALTAFKCATSLPNDLSSHGFKSDPITKSAGEPLLDAHHHGLLQTLEY